MTVPETAVYEDRPATRTVRQVWRAREIPVRDAVPMSQPVHQPPYDNLWFGSGPSDPPHSSGRFFVHLDQVAFTSATNHEASRARAHELEMSLDRLDETVGESKRSLAGALEEPGRCSL